AARSRLQIPTGGKELPAGAGHDGDARIRIVAEGGEGVAKRPARRGVDGIGFRSIENDLVDRAAPFNAYGVSRRAVHVGLRSGSGILRGARSSVNGARSAACRSRGQFSR